jgi:hypothetical protein
MTMSATISDERPATEDRLGHIHAVDRAPEQGASHLGVFGHRLISAANPNDGTINE